jgi:hypothetical protein
MKNRVRNAFYVLALLAFPILNLLPDISFAQGTAFTYQGQVQNNGSLAVGTYNLQFALYTNATGGTAVAGPVTNSAVTVTNGLFTVTIDFGSVVWNGQTNWLQIGVETNGGSSFTLLNPRQQATPTPYAIFAEGANAAGLSGTLPMSSLSGTYGGAVSLTNPGNSFTGNGAGLIGVNAATVGGLSAGNFWKIGGNNGVPTGSNYIGNNDNQYLDIHANGVRVFRLRLMTDGLGVFTNAPNVLGGSSVNLTAQNVVGAVIGGGGGNDTNGVAHANEVEADFGVIGGGLGNTNGGIGSFIGGGGYDGNSYLGNSIQANAAVIGGGFGNSISGGANYSFIGGGYQNTATDVVAVVGGGFLNRAGGYGTVGGGDGNQAVGTLATVGGGFCNTNAGIGSFIGGGGYNGTIFAGNVINANAATIGGGLGNNIPNTGIYAFIGGGESNNVSQGFSVVAGGLQNSVPNAFSTVSGGANNTASGPDAIVGGGFANTASGFGAAIGGGESNMVSGQYAMVSGGALNNVSGSYATVGGGYDNQALSVGSSVGGGNSNTNSGSYATVAGGYLNTASGDGSFIGGGGYNDADNIGNLAAGTASVVGGGELNTVYSAGLYGTIAGGHENYINTDRGTIGGGEDNQMNGSGSVIGGGESNGTGSGSDNATVGGGYNNAANGTYSTIPGGQNNYADGKGSFAAGSYAGAGNNGSFVWSDNTGTGASDTGVNQFVARASGGFFFYTGTGGSGAKLAGGATSWTVLCDRNAKKNFQPVDTVAVLNKLTAVPIEQWNYKWEKDTDTPNIGPMAQDFKRAFYPGRDDKGITTLEFDGVELAAIQGLNQKLADESRDQSAQIQSQAAEIEHLKKQNDSLADRLNELAAMVKGLEQKNETVK